MRYFIIPFASKHLEQIKTVMFGDLATQRRSLDGKYFLCCLNEGDTSDYDFLQEYPEYNDENITKILDNDNWRIKI